MEGMYFRCIIAGNGGDSACLANLLCVDIGGALIINCLLH
jgi:hypothetical protein